MRIPQGFVQTHDFPAILADAEDRRTAAWHQDLPDPAADQFFLHPADIVIELHAIKSFNIFTDDVERQLSACPLFNVVKQIFISIFLSAADFAYFYALSIPGAMISIVSMIRRGSVVVSFFVGAMVFHEKNLRSKAVDLALALIGMVFLYLGSK